MPASPAPASTSNPRSPRGSFLSTLARNLASQGDALRSYFRNFRKKASPAPQATQPMIQIHPHWYKKPKFVIPLVLLSISYIYLNIWVYNRTADISDMKLPFVSEFLKNPFQASSNKNKPKLTTVDAPASEDMTKQTAPQPTPTPAFTLTKKTEIPLTDDIRDDIPQAIDVTIDPLSKESKTYAILVSAHDSTGIKGVTVTIPASKKPPRQLALVKGTPQDGVWRTDTVLAFTGPTIQLVIDVENASARTTTEVSVP